MLLCFIGCGKCFSWVLLDVKTISLDCFYISSKLDSWKLSIKWRKLGFSHAFSDNMTSNQTFWNSWTFVSLFPIRTLTSPLPKLLSHQISLYLLAREAVQEFTCHLWEVWIDCAYFTFLSKITTHYVEFSINFFHTTSPHNR